MNVCNSASQQLAGEAVAILESISDGFFSVNEDWEFTYANRQAERILDVRREQIVGKNLWDTYPGLLGTPFETAYRGAMRENAPAEVTAFFPKHERWYEVRIAPVAPGLSFYFRDVTAQVKTEQALRESERDFRQMADSIPQIVWIVEASGQAFYFNRQWLAYTGVAIDSTTPVDVANEFVHPDDRATTMAAWGEAYRHRGRFQVEHRIRSKAGGYRWFLVLAEPFHNAAGEVERWFGTSTDIHEQKLAKIALRESEERYRSLFESMDDGFAIIDVVSGADDAMVDLRFRQANSVFAQLAGLPGGASVAGKTVRELAPGDDQGWTDLCARVALSGKSIRQTNEYKLFGRWFDLHAYRVDDPAERRVAVIF